MIARALGRLRSSGMARTAVALYGAHLVGLVVPLVAVPYLARVLRPEGWGMVVFAQSFAAWLALVLEYGFYLSATREIARWRADRERMAQVVAGVQGARLVLLGIVTIGAGVAYLLVPAFQREPAYLFWGWAIAVVQGFTPFWYYQGVERMRGAALAEAGAKIAATAGVFVWVRDPADGWIALALQALAGLVWVVGGNLWIYRSVPFRGLRLRGAGAMLRDAFGLFVYRSAAGAYLQANAFIFGMIAGAPAVAFFGGAERIIRGAINLIHPATQVLYPRISNLVEEDQTAAGRLLGVSLVWVGGLGAGICLVAFFGAPWIVPVFLGPGYEAAIPILRGLALLPPIIALSTVVGIQWALPMRYDRPYYSLVIAAGAINAVLAVLLVPRYGALGMVGSVVAAESFVLLGLLLLAWWRGREIWREAMRGAAGALRLGLPHRPDVSPVES